MSDSTPQNTGSFRKTTIKLVQLCAVLVVLGVGGKALLDVAKREMRHPAPALQNSVATNNYDEQFARTNERLTYLEAQLASIEKALTYVQNQAEKPPAPAPENPAVEARLETLQNRLDALQNSRSSADEMRRISLISTFGVLQKSAREGKVFESELTQMTSLAVTDSRLLPILAELQPLAKEQTPTLDALKKQFERSVRRRMESSDDNTSLLGNLKTLVRVRKEGNAEGDDDESVIARAETNLNNGKPEEALRELSTLSANAAPFFVLFTQMAKNHLKVESALITLQLELANAGGQTTTP